MAFIQINIPVPSAEMSDIILAQLSELGFNGFEEREHELVGSIVDSAFDESTTKDVLESFGLTFTREYIKEQNWNALWESNFEPVVVDDFCAIRADFHPTFNNVRYELIINPKMSFGTGHHATTYLMIQQMSHLVFENKSVADFGTGTGILAILSEKMKAASVYAVDEDDWSIENAAENISRNDCSKITLFQSRTFGLTGTFDIILANINKNVILDNFPALCEGLEEGGSLLLSGLYEEDEAEILRVFNASNLVHNGTYAMNKWICILLKSDLKRSCNVIF